MILKIKVGIDRREEDNMYCQVCGAEILSGALTCQSCGSTQIENTVFSQADGGSASENRLTMTDADYRALNKYREIITKAGIPDETVFNSRARFVSGPGGGSLGIFFAIVIICSVLIIIETRGLITTIPEYVYYSGLAAEAGSASGGFSTMVITMIALGVLIAAEAALLIFIITRIRVTLSCFAVITENGVYGRGIADKKRRIEVFSFAYENITSAYRSGVVIIESEDRELQCDVGKKIETVGAIRIELMKYYKEKGVNAWVCRKCGRVHTTPSIKCERCGRLRKASDGEQP